MTAVKGLCHTTNSATSTRISNVLANKFLYDNDTIVHCDGQSWSSVEYKDVYERVYRYTTNDNGDGMERTTLEDCSSSATSTTSNPEVIVDYDNHSSPFFNVKGNDFVLNSIIGIFTNSKTYGFHNNATKMTSSLNGTEEIQTWVVDYNAFHFLKIFIGSWRKHNKKASILPMSNPS